MLTYDRPTINVKGILGSNGNFFYRAEEYDIPGRPMSGSVPIKDFGSLQLYLLVATLEGYSVVSELNTELLRNLARLNGRHLPMASLEGVLSDKPENSAGAVSLNREGLFGPKQFDENGVVAHLFDGWVAIGGEKPAYWRPLNREEKDRLSDIVRVE